MDRCLALTARLHCRTTAVSQQDPWSQSNQYLVVAESTVTRRGTALQKQQQGTQGREPVSGRRSELKHCGMWLTEWIWLSQPSSGGSFGLRGHLAGAGRV
ncbi:hypothetical protein Y1Q_0006701 [Alligator mississippiensis]|uniref:Uncharacterized protein n=1 Tax=Alligator mississippiensis TaxID=8496 RepID=A0A151NSU1_ALLMI|nr:hypothetical protein Y1Q_0006701 [Alligator mississippiensis]